MALVLPVPDLSVCAREPIHLSGAVQPYGCLIGCDLSTWAVAIASNNAVAMLGLAHGVSLIGQPIDALLDAKLLHDARNLLQGAMVSGTAERLIGIRIAPDKPPMDLAVHASDTQALLEFTWHEGADTGASDAILLVKSMTGRLKRAPNLARFLQMAAGQVRSVTGYDRVMIYRFLPDHSGEVVGEAIRPGLPPFMGLRYPASDIPEQARALYRRQWLRMIVDVDYVPAPIEVDPSIDPTGVDLSLATLRSVSPVHLEYLRNMGSAATLTVSLMAGDRLWGLIACHHEVPRRIAGSTCAAAEMFGQIISLQIEAREAGEYQADVERLRAAHDRLIADMASHDTLFDDPGHYEPMLRAIVPCDGVGIWFDGRFTGAGLTPPVSAIPALIAYLDSENEHDTVVSGRLAQDLPVAATFPERVAGLLALRFSGGGQNYLIFFRSEVIRTVVWGGNPGKPVELRQDGTGRIGPRRSFEAWRETVRGECVPWLPAERQIVETLRVSLLDVILRRTDLLARERKAAQESQSLLIAELNHRVKNVLALIRSLVRQSSQNSASIEEFTHDLERRIRALAFAHDQLNQVGWRGAPLRQLLDAEVDAWAGAAGARVSLEGPGVTLGSRAYQALALVFHEMMTNAAKYGGLSRPGSSLSVSWELGPDGELDIRWREAGGPPVSKPERRGFGTVIIEQTVPFELGGVSRVDYEPDGVVGRFVIPTNHLVEAGQDGTVALAVEPSAETVLDLSGRRLLLVEDSMMIALDAQSMLIEEGLNVEIAGNVRDAARALAISSFDAAVLDVNLSGETSFPVADVLIEAQIPFVFATGYGEQTMIPERFANTAIVAKPYDARSLRRALTVSMAAS